MEQIKCIVFIVLVTSRVSFFIKIKTKIKTDMANQPFQIL